MYLQSLCLRLTFKFILQLLEDLLDRSLGDSQFDVARFKLAELQERV